MGMFKNHPARTSFVAGCIGGFVAVKAIIVCAVIAHGLIEK